MPIPDPSVTWLDEAGSRDMIDCACCGVPANGGDMYQTPKGYMCERCEEDPQ